MLVSFYQSVYFSHHIFTEDFAPFTSLQVFVTNFIKDTFIFREISFHIVFEMKLVFS